MRVTTEPSDDDVTEAKPACWITRDEYELLERSAEQWEHSLAIQLQGRCGLRSFEVPQIKPKHIKRSEDGEHYDLRVPEGKDTDGTGGKKRDAYLPGDVERDLHRFQQERDISDDEPILDVTERTIQRWIKRAAENAGEYNADEDYWAGDEDWRFFSSHDLRRHFAQQLLVVESMNPRVVMRVGGWSNFESIKPYLNEPTPDVVHNEFEQADW